MAGSSVIVRMKTPAAAINFFTFICLLCFPSTVVSIISINKIQLPPSATGPEALAFELVTGKFYTGIADGRILKYEGPTVGFVDFGFAAPNRSKSVCDGTNSANPNPVCGRAVGMALHHATKKLYVCDAFYGFGVLGPEGGLVTQLSTSADGEPYRFCDGVDVHQSTGNVYFTDASAVYDIRQLEIAVSVNDSTGRLLKYDVEKKQVTVLFRNLSGAGGVAVDEEEKFVVVTEFIANKTVKIWLKGPNANKSEIINRQPTPDNIKRTTLNSFWLAAAMVNRRTQSLVPIGQRINPFGNVLQTVNLEQWYGNKSISEVQEYGGALYVASRYGAVTRKSLTARGVILNTFEELEGPILSQIRSKCPNIYTIGPLNEHFKIKLSLENGLSSQSSNYFWVVDRNCMSWLDQQPNKSVIYVSFG